MCCLDKTQQLLYIDFGSRDGEALTAGSRQQFATLLLCFAIVTIQRLDSIIYQSVINAPSSFIFLINI